MESSRSPPAAAFPTNIEEFDADDRISFSKLDNKFLLVQDDGTEFEFDSRISRWVPILDEQLLEEQQRAYKVEGVEEDVENKKKRKPDWVNGQDEGGRSVKHKKTKAPPPPRANTAVYVASEFSRKCGMIAEEIDSGKPRIKLYTDEKGEFKGDALIVFFKAPSVDMAITLMDDTHFRMDSTGKVGSGKMRVMVADQSYKKVKNDGNGEEGGQKERSKASMKDKQKIIKKTQKLDARLADWSDDEASTVAETGSRWDKVVILKHMFTLEELQEDPAALLDIKDDIREECGKLGEVTNVVLFDLEEEGIVSVRFTNAQSANACVDLMNGRAFAGQKVEAYIATGKEQFRKSKKKADEENDEE
ncbi:hypothetical protein B0O99DRAFT_614046 [Bisporella sp. PMI_857]|nr:hypothetical protein B0O99DRAFT_614046 [Bisporella sp. PMI_857]